MNTNHTSQQTNQREMDNLCNAFRCHSREFHG